MEIVLAACLFVLVVALALIAAVLLSIARSVESMSRVLSSTGITVRRDGADYSAPEDDDNVAVPRPVRRAESSPDGAVHLLANGVHHSWRPEGHPDVLAIRAGKHPTMSIEGE